MPKAMPLSASHSLGLQCLPRIQYSLPPPGLRMQSRRQIYLQPQDPPKPLHSGPCTLLSHPRGRPEYAHFREREKSGPLQNGKELSKQQCGHTPNLHSPDHNEEMKCSSPALALEHRDLVSSRKEELEKKRAILGGLCVPSPAWHGPASRLCQGQAPPQPRPQEVRLQQEVRPQKTYHPIAGTQGFKGKRWRQASSLWKTPRI